MKNLSFLRWVLGSVVCLSVMLTACGKSNRSDTPLRGGPGGPGGPGGVAIDSTCGTSGTSAVGMIYSDGSMNFQNQVAGFVSSWMDPNDLGTVDGSASSNQTGVDFKGKLKFAAGGQLIREQTGLEITIVDSFTVQGQKPAIAIASYNSKAISGSQNPTGRTFEVTFQDNYGIVKLAGQYDNSFAWGTVQYQNSKVAMQGMSPQSGTLGLFKISKCGLLD